MGNILQLSSCFLIGKWSMRQEELFNYSATGFIEATNYFKASHYPGILIYLFRSIVPNIFWSITEGYSDKEETPRWVAYG